MKKLTLTFCISIFSCTESDVKLKVVSAPDILKQVRTHNQKESVLVNYWATNCATSVEEIPMILEITEQYSYCLLYTSPRQRASE